jgi:hypothetical protein
LIDFYIWDMAKEIQDQMTVPTHCTRSCFYWFSRPSILSFIVLLHKIISFYNKNWDIPIDANGTGFDFFLWATFAWLLRAVSPLLTMISVFRFFWNLLTYLHFKSRHFKTIVVVYIEAKPKWNLNTVKNVNS